MINTARKLALSCVIDIAQEWNKGFIRIFGPHERSRQGIRTKRDIIDVLHNVLILWERGKREDLINVLQDTGFGKNDTFYCVAQAISEILPNESKEKKLLDGFLAGKERMQQEIKKEHVQRMLF